MRLAAGEMMTRMIWKCLARISGLWGRWCLGRWREARRERKRGVEVVAAGLRL